MYVPLWCKSNFSFLEGASHPEELVETAHALELPALALTDRDGVYGIVRAHVRAKELGLKLLLGSQVTLADGSLLVLLVQSHAGYRNLCRLLTAGRLRSPKGQSAVKWEEVCAHAAGLIALWGGGGSLLVREALPEPAGQPAAAGALREAFGDRLYALLARHLEDQEPAQEAHLRRHAARLGLPLVAGIEVLYHSPARRQMQDVLTCIRHGTTLATAGRLIRPNAEHALCAPGVLARRFEDVPDALARSVEIAQRCAFSLDELRYRYPSQRLPDGMTTALRLRLLTHEGARGRYPGGVPAPVTAQLDKELALIEKLDYPGYFLTLWEIVQYCRARGILCQGRGSAANSAVCFCLGITAINPVEMDLLFERFLSEERAEPPDIDLDIQHNRREEVLQHVYSTYGRTHAAMVANLVRYQPRSAMRDVGKALGISQTLLEQLSKLLSHHDQVTADLLRQIGFEPELPVHRHLLRIGNEILGFPRHLSIHPGGFLLGHEPVHDIVPIENATMPERTVIQWDKDDIDALGLFKVDLLALGALTQLDLCFRLLRLHRRQELSLATIAADDPDAYAMMRRGDTVGVFQIESRAQMAMLPRLRPERFYDLVIEISIVRPGPIAGDMVHPYLRRRHGLETWQYPHACLEPVLKKTLGVPLFQEQVMKLAMVAADYSPGEADMLRRDMAAWRRSGRIEQHHDRLVSRMRAKGITEKFAEDVFNQIRGFGEYGFPESHAASFAIIAYASAWLKCHYPDEFLCSILNAQPMGFYSAATLVDDAKRHGVVVRPVDVCRSAWDCTLEPSDAPHPPAPSPLRGEGEPTGTGEQSGPQQAGPHDAVRFAVRMGLRYVKSLATADGERIVRAASATPFASVEDFLARTRLDEGAVVRLAEAGALDSLDPHRRDALWAVRGAGRRPAPTLPLREAPERVGFPALTRPEEITWDYRMGGYSVRGHPMAALRTALRARGLPDARTVGGLRHGQLAHYVGAVINRQRPGTAKGVVFMTLEDETGFVNLVVWSRVFDRFALVARTAAVLGVSGTIQAQEGVVHLVAQRLWAPQLGQQPETVKSRDFQ